MAQPRLFRLTPECYAYVLVIIIGALASEGLRVVRLRRYP